MTDQPDEKPIALLAIDHKRLEKSLGREHKGRSVLGLHSILWIKAIWRMALLSSAILIGLIIVVANLVLPTEVDDTPDNLVALAAISLVFSIVWLVFGADS